MIDFKPIPPVFAEPEIDAPTLDCFRRCPAESVHPDDWVLLHDTIFRVRDVRQSKRSIDLIFTLYPALGGRIETDALKPREWLPVVFHAERT